MDQRKLIKLGNSSFAIALPKPWVDKSGLKKGDTIFITPNSNGELIIQPTVQKTSEGKEVLLSMEGKKERDINREIIASYINGGDLFNISMNKKDLGFVKEVLKDLSGVEIIESRQNSIMAREVIDLNSLSVESITRRIDNSVRNILEDLEPCIKKGRTSDKEYKSIMNADKDVNRFYFLLWRIMVLGIDNPSILNTLKTDSSCLVYSWLTGMNIEKIGDDLKTIARILSKNRLKEEEAKYLGKVFDQIKKNFIDALNSYHLKNKKLAFEITKNKEEIYNICSRAKGSEDIKEICNLFSKIQSNIHYIAKFVLYFIKQDSDKE